MRALRLSALVLFAAWVIAGAFLASPAAARVSTYKGQFLCDDRGVVTPLDGMNVELWERGSPDFLPVEIVGHRVDQAFTDSEGRFSLRTEDNNDNYFVRMALRDAHGVHLRDFWGINDWSVDSEQKRNDVAVRDYGGIVFRTPDRSHKCAVWAGVHHADEEFRSITGTDLPSHGVEIVADSVGEVPFTPGTSMYWTPDYPVGYDGGGDDSITRHEFAHAMRHGLDGDFGHFLGDAATFNYAQAHRPCDHQNLGYAFNEGWAEFWAGRYGDAPDCGRPGDYETEGNVAAALTALMENCAGGQKKIMVETLRNNPLRIHSYEEFRAALGCPIPKFFPITVIRLHTDPEPSEPTPPAVSAKIVHREVSAASKYIGGLEKSLKVAERKAQNAPACLKSPCAKALETVTRPATLDMEIALAKIQRAAAAASDSAKEQAKLGGLGFGPLVKYENKQEARNRKRIARAALAGVREILQAGRPVFKVDDSKFAKKAHRALTKAATLFRKATKKGSKSLPPSLTLQPLNPKELPHRFPKVPAPSPTPQPTFGLRTITGLAFTECPALAAAGKPIDVEGTLSPAVAGAAVTVTFSGPGSPATVTATTDSSGNWKANHTPGVAGAWSVDASYAGDSTYAASTAATCQVEYK